MARASGEDGVAVKEVVLDSAVVDILYLGKNHECVLVTTKSKRLYYSRNAGEDWTEITDKVDKSSNVQLQVERVIVSPTDKTVAILQTNRKTRSSDEDDASKATGGKWWPYIYITEDSGQTWRRAWGKHHGLHSWIAHPKERSWALVSWWAGDCGESGSGSSGSTKKDEEESEEDRKPCVHRLMLTKDLGKNFLQLAEYVVQFSWGSGASNQDNRVYFTAYKTKSGDQGRLSLWTTEVDFHYVDISASGRPRGRVVECLQHGNKFLISGEFVLVAKVKDEGQQTVHLMVSKDGGASFKAALLPSGMGELEEKWYTILDTSDGAVVLHINSNTGIKDTGRIFISDTDGYKYSQSLMNNVRSSQGESEFDRVVSLQGVYLANIVVPDATMDQSYKKVKEKAAEEVEKEAADGAEVDKRHGRGFSKGKSTKASKEERTIRTVISFDRGAVWKYLKPPKVDSNGKAYDCEGRPIEECALHLHGTTSWDLFAPFYSSESAVGIIMGTGNVGTVLRFEPEETNTYLSRDGGLTWRETNRGAYIYEFGDHGGLIVMADDLKKTTKVLYSWNEGESWSDFTVSKTPFEVDNIITEPNVTGTKFIMFGTREEGVGVMYHMTFGSLNFPTCHGAWGADSVSSDYETWTPSTGGAGSEQCLLGQQVTYTRRKRTSQCWNGEKFERPVVQKRCACTKEDFSCDIGFVRAVNQQECVYGGAEMMPERFIPSTCSKTFSASAYRKVAGDRCEGGWKPEPAEVPCPTTLLGGSYLRYWFMAAVLAGAAWYKYKSGSSIAGGKTGLGDFSAVSILAEPRAWLQAPMDSVRWLSAKLSGGRGFQSYGGVGYKKVQGDEFDMDNMNVGNDDSALDDFIDESENDDSAPRVYTSAAEDRRRGRREDDRPAILPGGAQAARHDVPRLQAPPTHAVPIQFNIADDDDDKNELL